jgi:hypothetical protein
MRMLREQEMSEEQLGEGGRFMKQTDHDLFVDAHETGVFHAGRGCGTNGLSGEAGFPQKGPAFQNRDHCFLAFLGHDRELDLTLLDIEDRIRRVPLRKENLLLGGRQQGSSIACAPCPPTCMADRDALTTDRRLRECALRLV